MVLTEDNYTIEDGNLLIHTEAWKNLSDGKYEVSTIYRDGTEDSFTVIVEDGAPTGIIQHNAGAWSLFDLIALLLTACLLLVYIIKHFGKKKREEEDQCEDQQQDQCQDQQQDQQQDQCSAEEEPENEEEPEKEERLISALAIILAPLFNLLLFIFTQDLTCPMTFFDIWSLLFAVILAIQIVCFILINKKRKEEEPEEEEEPALTNS